MSEEELCAAFATWAKAGGWTVYPEVQGWDLVLVPQNPFVKPALDAGGSACSTEQVGIHAKTSGNVKVLAQVIDPYGPRVRFVLVPRATEEFLYVARALGVGVIAQERQRSYFKKKKWVADPVHPFQVLGASKEWSLCTALPLPPVVPDLPAGVKSPKQLTPWRVNALKLCYILRHRGYVTSADFKALKLSMGTWTRHLHRGANDSWQPWLHKSGEKEGRLERYVRTFGAQLPDEGWEAVTEQLRRAGELDIPDALK